MNWDAIGAIGEILGAAAVVLTLAYLSIQIRHAKDTAADVNRLNRAVGIRDMISAQKTVPGLCCDHDEHLRWYSADPIIRAVSENHVGVYREYASG